MPIVVIISDCTDVAYAEMRGAILTNADGADVRIEPLVPTAPFSVVDNAFGLRLMADAYPPGTILSFIMNSLVERPERIVGRTVRKDMIFEGPNTGAVGWLLDDFGLKEVYELHDPGFVPFGGKYVHAPAVGKLAAGADLATIANPFPPERVRRLPLTPGLIVHVDNFGNIKFPWPNLEARPGDRFRATVRGHWIDLVYWIRMMERADGEWVLYPGSSWDLLEIGQVRGKGFCALDVHPGDMVHVERI